MARRMHNTLHILLLVLLSVSGADAWSPGSCHLSHRRVSTRLSAEQDENVADDVESKHSGYNVLGTELSCCCSNVGGSGIGTGFYRNGFCGK